VLEWVQAIAAAVDDARRGAPDLPLDIQATSFQRAVWELLRTIPVGETRTYAEVAAMLGKPTATRAVAGACARNQTALLIPCHRVVRSGGVISGYRWGAARKRALLAGEQGDAGEITPSLPETHRAYPQTLQEPDHGRRARSRT
jgi:AraC family transcriptional regulator of adaptative response/methylated-DNA-[protein]-cysteine methyltransferase